MPIEKTTNWVEYYKEYKLICKFFRQYVTKSLKNRCFYR